MSPHQRKLLQKLPPDLTSIERHLNGQGYELIAGVDEAGRGCLAGPVVAASVVLSPGCVIEGIKDSKKLTPRQRERFFDVIQEQAFAWSVGAVDAGEIDRINILKASLAAMRDAVMGLSIRPDYLLIDGRDTVQSDLPQRAVIKGDDTSQTIAAASVLAKVTRDRMMVEYKKVYPTFSFDVHKGYGTALHLSELRKHGPTPIHRMTFRGVGK